MPLGKEKTIQILAITVILISIGCTLFVHARQVEIEQQLQHYQKDEKIVTIFNQDYTINKLFLELENKTIDTDEGEKTGIALDSLIEYTGINCPSCNKYTFKAIDGYQQTVDWSNMKKGILTENSRVIFPDLAHAFWVRDVIKIETS